MFIWSRLQDLILRPILFICLAWGLLGGQIADGASPCLRLLEQEGIGEELVNRFCRELTVSPAIIGKNLKQVEYQAVYDRFLEPATVGKGRLFLKENRAWLSGIEALYQVEGELITAIFLVESDLGRYQGSYSLLEVFFSLASCAEEQHLRVVYAELKKSYPELEYQWLQRRAQKKALWGYEQLVALFKLSDRIEVDQVKGSWAGAFGICQFIPSSCLNYAVDGNGDGRIDLYDFKDAAASVAHYLKKNGWRPGLDRQAREDVVWSYNHSKLYCRTVVELAYRLQ
ncbi:MAG TPA: lytic murein transglycosylase [Proteobacteria bacterium]|nr:lytic murein transglycosylase [Pseudomonadota bacterium]